MVAPAPQDESGLNASQSQSRRRQALAAALIVYGVAGLAIAASLVAILVSAPVTALIDGVAEQKSSLARSLDATALTMSDAAQAADGIDKSLEGTAAAARHASSLTASLASSMRGLADSMDLELFGSRPFSALADDFQLVGDEAMDVSTDLGRTAGFLDANREDSRRIAADFRALRTEVQRLDELVDRADIAGGELATLRSMMVLLLAWQALPALVAIVVGLLLLRSSVTRTTQPA